MKAASISRLELCSAQLGIQWWLQLHQKLGKKKNDVTFWSDSKNVLYWLNKPAKQFKVFVAHRVGEIQDHSKPNQWRHVPGEDNPADIPSRGLKVRDLVQSSRFYEGPSFLLQSMDQWPETKLDLDKKNIPAYEHRSQALICVVKGEVGRFLISRASVGSLWDGWLTYLRRMNLLLRIQISWKLFRYSHKELAKQVFSDTKFSNLFGELTRNLVFKVAQQ